MQLRAVGQHDLVAPFQLNIHFQRRLLNKMLELIRLTTGGGQKYLVALIPGGDVITQCIKERLARKIPGRTNLTRLQDHTVAVVTVFVPFTLMPRQRREDFFTKRDNLFFGEVIFQFAPAGLLTGNSLFSLTVIQFFQLAREKVNFLKIAAAFLCFCGELDQARINGLGDPLDRRCGIPLIAFFP